MNHHWQPSRLVTHLAAVRVTQGDQRILIYQICVTRNVATGWSTETEIKFWSITQISKDCVCIFHKFQFLFKLKPCEKPIYLLIVTIKYQNVRSSVNFCHLIIGPGMLPGLSNRPKLYFSFSGSPCTAILIQEKCMHCPLTLQRCSVTEWQLLVPFFVFSLSD